MWNDLLRNYFRTLLELTTETVKLLLETKRLILIIWSTRSIIVCPYLSAWNSCISENLRNRWKTVLVIAMSYGILHMMHMSLFTHSLCFWCTSDADKNLSLQHQRAETNNKRSVGRTYSIWQQIEGLARPMISSPFHVRHPFSQSHRKTILWDQQW